MGSAHNFVDVAVLICFSVHIMLQLATSALGEYSPTPNSLYFEELIAVEHNEKIETGLEFISDDQKLQLDKKIYAGPDAFAPGRFIDLSPLQLVQMFTRNLKDLPRNGGENFYIGIRSMDDLEYKPAWSFFPYRLKKLAKIEARIYKILKRYTKENENSTFPVLRSYLLDFEESSLQVISRFGKKPGAKIDDPYMYIGSHSLLIYRMIRRFVEDLQPILSKLKHDEGLILSIYNEANPDMEVFPTGKDLYDAMEALVRIQFMTETKTEDLAKGILEKLNTRIQLNALQALEVGALHIDHSNYDLAVQWIYFAWKRVSTSRIVHKFPIINNFFLDMLNYAVSEHNKRWKKFHDHEWEMGVFSTAIESSNSFDVASYTRKLDVRKLEAAKPVIRKNPNWSSAVPMNSARVCSGVNLQTEEEKRQLRCWYIQHEHYFTYISPLKAEMLSAVRQVVQIYEFIGEKLMEDMKDAVIDNLDRSLVINIDNPGESVPDGTRTSVQAWLDEDNDAFMQPLSRKLEMLTRLKILPTGNASDAYQVASYGPSHHYDIHLDAFTDLERISTIGNRIVTVMGYLGDVAVGGRTAFPVLGTFAEPIKGSIVIWENMDADMTGRDGHAFHGGCPVVLGVKWITNKWIYSHDNMFKYPCPALRK